MDGIEVYAEATAHGAEKNEMHELTKPETIIALLDISRAERLQNDCEQWADKCKPHICKCQLQKWPQIRLHLSILWMAPISIAGSLARSDHHLPIHWYSVCLISLSFADALNAYARIHLLYLCSCHHRIFMRLICTKLPGPSFFVRISGWIRLVEQVHFRRVSRSFMHLHQTWNGHRLEINC